MQMINLWFHYISSSQNGRIVALNMWWQFAPLGGSAALFWSSSYLPWSWDCLLTSSGCVALQNHAQLGVIKITAFMLSVDSEQTNPPPTQLTVE